MKDFIGGLFVIAGVVAWACVGTHVVLNAVTTEAGILVCAITFIGVITVGVAIELFLWWILFE